MANLASDGLETGTSGGFLGSFVAPRLKTFFGALLGGPRLRCPLKYSISNTRPSSALDKSS